jgi:outer membrane scaffolding protein for murein synthesis (MipA/OmpV family)
VSPCSVSIGQFEKNRPQRPALRGAAPKTAPPKTRTVKPSRRRPPHRVRRANEPAEPDLGRGAKIINRQLACLTLLWACAHTAWSQTPSPLQEWQYSGGLILARLFQPDLPEWRRIVGAAAEVQPVYDGSRAYRLQGGPVVNIQYRDIAFVSTGEGIGYNFLRGDHYRVGAAISYDLGRRVKDDITNLHGMGDLSPAPAAKLFASLVLSRKFPLILRTDVRQLVGGANGTVGDVGVYMPLPGSSKKFVMFAGPSITLATHRYLQSEFGVTPAQSLASGHPAFDPHAGTAAVGVGFSATQFLTDHWLLNLDSALSRLKGSANVSPIPERRTQRVLVLSASYLW